nr:expressed protein [Hymenolepis microstoma]
MGPVGGPGMPQTFKNCKAPVCHNGQFTGYGCSNGICPYICHGGACTQVGSPMMTPSTFPGRQMGNHFAMSNAFGMQEPNFGGFGGGMMTGMSGAGPNMMDPYGNSAFGGYDGYGYGQDMGYPPQSSSGSNRRGRSKRESCPNGDCEDDDKSGESGKANSGNPN